MEVDEGVEAEAYDGAELQRLREQQELLEKELLALNEDFEASVASGLIDANTLQSPAVEAEVAAAISAGERLEELRRRHRRETRQTMQRYFEILNNFRGYQDHRRKKLRKVQPFSFEARELRRPQTIHARRMEEDRLRRDLEERRALKQRFRPNPVPPSTYMNKYDLMLEEWRQRRAMVGAIAAEKAERIKEEKEVMQLCVKSLRSVREIMGVRRREREHSGHDATLGGRECREVKEIRDIPVEVKLKLWPAIEEHEQIRCERIKQRAVCLMSELKAADAQRVAVPEHASQSQAHFGMTPADFFLQQQMHSQDQSVAAAGVVPVKGPVVTVPSQQGVTTSAPAVAVLSVPPTVTQLPTNVPVMGPLAKPDAPQEVTVAGEDKAKKKPSGRSASAGLNPNLTFRPHIRNGVPNFEALWAEDRLALAERKRKFQTTQVEPFNLTASRKDNLVRGRSVARKKQQRCVSAARALWRAGPTSAPSKKEEGEEAAKAKAIPIGTRSHAMRTQAVFQKYVTAVGVEHVGDKRAEETAALREACRRQKVVNARLKEYLKDVRCKNDSVIRQKVKDLRRLGRIAARQAAEQLDEMRSRVAQMPPIFVEPTHLHDAAKARVEAEREILDLLRESGVGYSTLAAILNRGGGGSIDDKDDSGASPDAAEEEKDKPDNLEDSHEVKSDAKKSEGSESHSGEETESDGSDTKSETTRSSENAESESHEDDDSASERFSKSERADSAGESKGSHRSDTKDEDETDGGSDKDSEYGNDFESTSSGS